MEKMEGEEMSVLKIRPVPLFDDHERFLKYIKVNQGNGCWEWQANKRYGYGRFSIVTVGFPSHRVSYEIFVGKIRNGFILDHICRNRSCCNPDHLRQVTIKENVTNNSISNAAKNKAKTHCVRGHEFTPENTRNQSRGRRCATCERIRMRKRNDILKLNRALTRQAQKEINQILSKEEVKK